jgi:hypothetical protein
MHVVIRRFPKMHDVKEAAERSRSGLAKILKQQPGFKGYFVIRLDGGGGGSITLFDRAEQAQRAHDRAMWWIRENLADLPGSSEFDVTMGEVVAAVTDGKLSDDKETEDRTTA